MGRRKRMVEVVHLKFINSMHEMREVVGMGAGVPKVGNWIEVLDFDRKTEKVDIHQRLEIMKIDFIPFKKGKEMMVLHCVKRNVVEEQERVKVLAERVLEKHKDILKASLVKCYVEGLSKESYSLGYLSRRIKKQLEGEVNEKGNSE
jgi:hypothetical protein